MTMAVLGGPVLNAYFRPGGACLPACWRGADQASGALAGLRWAHGLFCDERVPKTLAYLQNPAGSGYIKLASAMRFLSC